MHAWCTSKRNGVKAPLHHYFQILLLPQIERTRMIEWVGNTSSGRAIYRVNGTLRTIPMRFTLPAPVPPPPLNIRFFGAPEEPATTEKTEKKEQKMAQNGLLYCKCHNASEDGVIPTWVARRSRVIRQSIDVGMNVISMKAEWYHMEDRGYDEQANNFLVRRDEELRLDSHSGRQRYEETVVETEEIISVHCKKCGTALDLDHIQNEGDALTYVRWPEIPGDWARKVIAIPHHDDSDEDEDDDEEGDEE